MSDRVTTGPLEGIRVLELGSVVAGPFAGRILADFGADVVKIEAPDRPDPLRDWGQESYRGYRLWWTVHARNKRCVTLDLRAERGQELLLDLVANGVHRCPYCHTELAVIAVVVPAEAAHIRTPEVTHMSPT